MTRTHNYYIGVNYADARAAVESIALISESDRSEVLSGSAPQITKNNQWIESSLYTFCSNNRSSPRVYFRINILRVAEKSPAVKTIGRCISINPSHTKQAEHLP